MSIEICKALLFRRVCIVAKSACDVCLVRPHVSVLDLLLGSLDLIHVPCILLFCNTTNKTQLQYNNNLYINSNCVFWFFTKK